jgi:hypothetical protein
METTLTGTVVGINDESWPATATRAGGRRVTLWLQCNVAGCASPSEVIVDDPFRGGISKELFGKQVSIGVAIRTFEGSRNLMIRATGAAMPVTAARAA